MALTKVLGNVIGSNTVDNTNLSAGAVEQYFADTGYNTQFRNRIINGDMRIDQRNAGAAVTGSGEFPVDRFLVGNTTDGAFSAQQDSSAPAGFTNSVKITATTADATLTTTQFLSFQHRIEGTNVADLGWGTANAKTVTLSFWVRSSLTGTFGGALRNSANNRSYPFTYSISVADTWEQKSVTIEGDTSGTWLTTTDLGIRVFFGLGAGPDASGTAGAWNSNNNVSATGAVSVIGTLNATWYITGVQLEVGSVATPFERRPYGTELSLCQRYYEKSYNQETVPGTNVTSAVRGLTIGGYTPAANWTGTAVVFRVEKRTTPTMVYYDAAGTSGKISIFSLGGFALSNNITGPGVSYPGTSCVVTGSVPGAGIPAFAWTSTAEL